MVQMPAWGLDAILIASMLPLACAALPLQTGDERVAFVRRLDKALQDRDPVALARLSNVISGDAKAIEPSIAQPLSLPPGRLSRKQELSERQLLYADAAGRTWRVSLIYEESRGWLARSRASLCGPGTVPDREQAPEAST